MRSEERSFIRLSGGLITSHFMSLLQDSQQGFEYARPETFLRPWREEDAPPQNEKEFLSRVGEVWDHLRILFDEKYRNIKSGKISADDARRFWQLPILDALGFEPTYTAKQIIISDQVKYHFSHRGWFPRKDVETRVPTPPVIHILPPGTDPDTRPAPKQPSPHDALQNCLNRNDATWALLMNETAIRVIRDYHHTTVPGYIEFDLEGIFLNRSFPEFLALYRFCHASRFARDAETGKEPLEDYYEVSRQAGEKIGQSLRENVVTAIERLGNGFLDEVLIDQLKGDREACQAYYQEILTVVYRVIFMLFAEQRGMLGIEGAHGDLFLEEYSITSLRERVDAFEGRDDRHTDLWEGLSVTFGMLEKGVPELGVNAFDGLLFSRANEQYLKDARCRNTALMDAIRALTWTVPITEGRGRRERVYGRQRISYADLSVEEIGAIYESLLDYTPRITKGFETIDSREYRPREFMLDPRGSERKSTGSYYTNPDLIAELIKSALDPVIANTISQAGPEPAAREKALLSIRVCDPACGSGAFLIAAANRLGHELAKIRTGTELPAAKDVRAARRDVLSHCIYGVDLNPMAVELAKVSLWINALVDDKPLSFLDHHIKCGNSLIGTTPALLAGGIPDDAYSPVEGDSKDVATRIKKANKEQRQSRTFSEFEEKAGLADQCAERFAALIECSENNPEAVDKKRREYERLRASAEYERERWAADTWCAAFFWPLTKEQAEKVPTTETVRMVRTHGKNVLPEELQTELPILAKKHRFFHWHLEFPEVFKEGGFDGVLGNPPWERIKLQEKEFFEVRDPDVAGARNAAERARKITALKQSNPTLYAEFLAAKRASECESLFLRSSGRFPLTGKGDINTYTVFAEHARSALSPFGHAGIIVPTGIATDATTAEFFGDLVDNISLVSLYDFENKEGIFPIHRSYKFCLLTMAGVRARSNVFDLAFFLHKIDHLNDENRHFTLTPEEIALINPNTRNCPVFHSRKDANLVINVYRSIPVLINNITNENPWNIAIRRIFDMNRTDVIQKCLPWTTINNDSNLFRIYEAKMMYQYDHRFGNHQDKIKIASKKLKQTDIDSYRNTEFRINSFYWIERNEVFTNLIDKWNREWLVTYRNIARSTDERTIIAAILPLSGTDFSLRVIFSKESSIKIIHLLANFNSIILDYIARFFVAGANVSDSITKQLPILPPSVYTHAPINFIAPRVIELTYTAWDLEPFALDLLKEVGKDQWNKWFSKNPIAEDGRPRPFIWDVDRRFTLRCDLDALYFHLYEISRDDVDYIMETFPLMKRKDMAEYGSYRTKEVILAKYDELAKDFVRVMRADLPRKNGEIDWKAIISKGENERVEFKSSISWDVNTKQKNKALEHTIAKTIASFMNTHGGILFIGVNDAGEFVGLEGDIKISKGQNEDGLRLKLDDLIKNYLGNQFLPLIKVHSLKEKGVHYWAVEIKPIIESVFVNQNGEQEYWIRGISSSRRLSMREAVEYIEKRKKEGISPVALVGIVKVGGIYREAEERGYR